jgi:hypothetical protein
MEAFCRRRGYSGRRTGAELLGRLCTAPVSASRLREPVVPQMIRAQVAVVRALQAGIDTLDTMIAEKAGAPPSRPLQPRQPHRPPAQRAGPVTHVSPRILGAAAQPAGR